MGVVGVGGVGGWVGGGGVGWVKGIFVFIWAGVPGGWGVGVGGRGLREASGWRLVRARGDGTGGWVAGPPPHVADIYVVTRSRPDLALAATPPPPFAF